MTTSFVDALENVRTSDKELACGLKLYSSASAIDNENLEVDVITTSVDGVCTYNNVRIKRSGQTYHFVYFSADKAVTEKSSADFVISSNLLSITYALSDAPYIFYFNFMLTVKAFGEGGFPYLEGVTLELKIDDSLAIGGYKAAETGIVTGTHDFNIFIISTGDRELTVKAIKESETTVTLEKKVPITVIKSTIKLELDKVRFT